MEQTLSLVNVLNELMTVKEQFVFTCFSWLYIGSNYFLTGLAEAVQMGLVNTSRIDESVYRFMLQHMQGDLTQIVIFAL